MHVQLMIPAFCSSCDDVLNKWETILSSSQGSREIDVVPYMENLTGDAISKTAFGNRYQDGTKIFQLQKEKAFYFVQDLQSIYIPGWR